MEQDTREQLLNQFFINNMNKDRIDKKISRRKYFTAKEALAQRLTQDEDLTAARSRLYFSIISYPKVLSEYFFKDSSLVNKNNDPFELNDPDNSVNWSFQDQLHSISRACTLRDRGVEQGPFYHQDHIYLDARDIKDEDAEREIIETNLTYDGYCAFLSVLPAPALLHFKDSIALGINTAAKESISQATSTEELNDRHQDFLQLKAAAEHLFEQAEFQREDFQQTEFEQAKWWQDYWQQQEQLKQQEIMQLQPQITEALKDFEE